MKDRLFTFALAVAALVAVVFLLSPSEKQQLISVPSTEDSGRDGLKGLLVWLQREQVPSSSFRQPYTALLQHPDQAASGNVLLMSLPSHKDISRAEWAALAKWLAKGNTVLVMAAAYQYPAWSMYRDCFCKINSLLSLQHWRLAREGRKDAKADEEDEEDEDDNAADHAPVAPAEPLPPKAPPVKPESAKPKPETFQGVVNQVRDAISAALKPQTLVPLPGVPWLADLHGAEADTAAKLLERPWQLASDSPDNLALRLLTLQGTDTTVAWQISAGQGQILLVLTPDLFSNRLLNHADNARLFDHLLAQTLAPGGQVLFDDYHFGLSALYDPQHFFSDSRLHQSLLCLGLLWLLYVLGYTNRLAPVRSRTPALSAQDFIIVTAEFFARRLPPRQLAHALVKHLLQDVCQQRHLPDEAAALAWLGQHSRISAGQLAALKQAYAGQRLALIPLTHTLTYIRTVTL